MLICVMKPCPPMVRDNRHNSVYWFGAICRARKVGTAIIMPSGNATISGQVAQGAHGGVVCEGAGWHHPRHTTLLLLPPYVPQLNPIENAWDYLRRNKLSKCVRDTLRGNRRCVLGSVDAPCQGSRADRLDRASILGVCHIAL